MENLDLSHKKKYLLELPDNEVIDLPLKDYAQWVRYKSLEEAKSFIREIQKNYTPSSPKGYPEKSVKTQYKSFKAGSKPRVYNSWID